MARLPAGAAVELGDEAAPARAAGPAGMAGHLLAVLPGARRQANLSLP